MTIITNTLPGIEVGIAYNLFFGIMGIDCIRCSRFYLAITIQFILQITKLLKELRL
jgi:hypothetical protein